MAKSDVTAEMARALVDRIAQEKGLLVNETSGFLKVQGPTNKHRIYIQKSKMLKRIDCTLPVGTFDASGVGDPGTLPLSAPNGSITCHIVPELAHLERFLLMLADGNMGTQVPNKPRPFAANKVPARRQPRAVAPPVNEFDVGPTEYIAAGGTLDERLSRIASGARKARIRNLMENRGISEEEAIAILDRKVEEEDVVASQTAANELQTGEVMREAGIEVES